MNKPIAIAIGDVHFSNPTLKLALNSTRQALEKARALSVPLVINGDLNDTKSVIRGEVANTLIKLLSEYSDVRVMIVVGNHDLLHEKSKEHGLNYLRPYAQIIDDFYWDKFLDTYFIPYQSDSTKLLELLTNIPNDKTLFMHQGIRGAAMGDYILDKSSIDLSYLSRFKRVFLSHYHRHQVLNNAVYIGSPYSVTFGEANDGPKGFMVINEDGSYEQVPTNLRKHVVVETTVDKIDEIEPLNKEDLLQIKVTGPYSEIQKLDKKAIGLRLLGHSNFKLTPTYTDGPVVVNLEQKFTAEELMDKIIDSSNESLEQKIYLQHLWREVFNENPTS